MDYKMNESYDYFEISGNKGIRKKSNAATRWYFLMNDAENTDNDLKMISICGLFDSYAVERNQ
jgi:hypothetical protein